MIKGNSLLEGASSYLIYIYRMIYTMLRVFSINWVSSRSLLREYCSFIRLAVLTLSQFLFLTEYDWWCLLYAMCLYIQCYMLALNSFLICLIDWIIAALLCSMSLITVYTEDPFIYAFNHWVLICTLSIMYLFSAYKLHITPLLTLKASYPLWAWLNPCVSIFSCRA